MQAQAMMALIPAAGQVTRHAWLPNDGTDSFHTWSALTQELNEEMTNKVSFFTAHLLWVFGLLGLDSCSPKVNFTMHRHPAVSMSSKTAWLKTLRSVEQ